MNIIKNLEGSKLEISLEGRLDSITAPELDNLFKNSLQGITELVIDLKELEYISSAGLRALLVANKIMDRSGSMKVRNVNELVMEVFKVTGFSNILNIE